MAGIAFPIGGIDDGVVRLRLPADSDLEAVVEATQDPEIVRWTRVPAGNTLGQARDWLAGTRRGNAEGGELHLLITDATDDQLLGAIGIHRLSSQGECDIGYWLSAPARGRGLATAALRLLSGWLFSEHPVERIVARAEPANVASCAVTERAGFQFEGSFVAIWSSMAPAETRPATRCSEARCRNLSDSGPHPSAPPSPTRHNWMRRI